MPTNGRKGLLSRFIFICDSSIFLNNSASPITRAASRTSLHVSSNRVMTRTIVPSGTSVNSVICSNGYGMSKIWPKSRLKGAYHALCPLIHNFNKPKLQVGAKILNGNLMRILDPAHPLTDSNNCVATCLQLRWDFRLDICLFLEHETRQQRDDLLRFIIGQTILENEFRKN